MGIWSQVFNVERLSTRDDFFALGGDSILATQIISRIRAVMRVELSFPTFFTTPTISDMAKHIETAHPVVTGTGSPPLVPVSQQGKSPPTAAQAHLWRLEQACPGSFWFNRQYTLRLTGLLNMAILEGSFNDIVSRHESLRTVVVAIDGQPRQVVTPARRVAFPVRDLRRLSKTSQEVEIQRIASEEAQRSFEPASGPLFRVRLLRLGTMDQVLLLTMHHLISDGWSIGVLARELAHLYQARSGDDPSPLPELPIQYADYAYWQQQWLTSEAQAIQLAYWKQQLRAPLPLLALPLDYPRTTALSFETARQSIVVPPELYAGLSHLSSQEGTTLFMTLLAAFNVLLYHDTGQEDLIVGTLVANRNRQALEGLIGLMANTLLIRTNLGGNPSLRDVLQPSPSDDVECLCPPGAAF